MELFQENCLNAYFTSSTAWRQELSRITYIHVLRDILISTAYLLVSKENTSFISLCIMMIKGPNGYFLRAQCSDAFN